MSIKSKLDRLERKAPMSALDWLQQRLQADPPTPAEQDGVMSYLDNDFPTPQDAAAFEAWAERVNFWAFPANVLPYNKQDGMAELAAFVKSGDIDPAVIRHNFPEDAARILAIADSITSNRSKMA